MSLQKDLQNKTIDFYDESNNLAYVFDFTKKKLCGDLTEWKHKSIKINIDKKYRYISKVINNRYYGEYNNGIYKNMRATIYKIKIKKNMFSKTYRYIFMIIETKKNVYDLIIFNLNRCGTYIKYLTDTDIIYSSLYSNHHLKYQKNIPEETNQLDELNEN